MKNIIIVTGGAGFIGSHMVKMLLKAGYEVAVLDNFSTGDQDKLHALGCMYIEEDVENVTAAMKIEHDVLFHLAAPVSVEESLNDPNKYYRQILGGTANIVNWSLDSGNRDIIIAKLNIIYNQNDRSISDAYRWRKQTDTYSVGLYNKVNSHWRCWGW